MIVHYSQPVKDFAYLDRSKKTVEDLIFYGLKLYLLNLSCRSKMWVRKFPVLQVCFYRKYKPEINILSAGTGEFSFYQIRT